MLGRSTTATADSTLRDTALTIRSPAAGCRAIPQASRAIGSVISAPMSAVVPSTATIRAGSSGFWVRALARSSEVWAILEFSFSRNGGNFGCVSWGQVGLSAGIGAIAGGTLGLGIAAEEAGELASAAEGLAAQAPNFVVTPAGVVIPVPEGAAGPVPTNSPGFQFNGGAGGERPRPQRD